MPGRARLLTLCAVAALVALVVPAVHAAPPELPFLVEGSARVNGLPVAGGTSIGGWCGGVKVASTATVTVAGESLFSLEIKADDPATPAKDGCANGETVEFTIATLKAVETATWASGGNVNLELTAGAAKKASFTTLALHDADEVTVTSVPVGTAVHALAQVTGAALGNPTGTVTFEFYANGTCSGAGVPSGVVSLSAGLAHPSDEQVPSAAGSYGFKAYYSGDANYEASNSACKLLTVRPERMYLYLPLLRR